MGNSLMGSLLELRDLLEIQAQDTSVNYSRRPQNRKSDYYRAKTEYEQQKLQNIVDTVQNKCLQLKENVVADNTDNENILKIVKIALDKEAIKENLPVLIKLAEGIKGKSEDKGARVRLPANIPPEIRTDVFADLSEMEKCFNSGCYRACTIICGRIIETCLHRKYYEVTGMDLLEKNPGIGLGKLIAKMSEKEIKLDPGLTQQIHLINQVRIYSVHKKSESFSPSKEQSYAMILYTLDVMEKLF